MLVSRCRVGYVDTMRGLFFSLWVALRVRNSVSAAAAMSNIGQCCQLRFMLDMMEHLFVKKHF